MTAPRSPKLDATTIDEENVEQGKSTDAEQETNKDSQATVTNVSADTVADALASANLNESNEPTAPAESDDKKEVKSETTEAENENEENEEANELTEENRQTGTQNYRVSALISRARNYSRKPTPVTATQQQANAVEAEVSLSYSPKRF